MNGDGDWSGGVGDDDTDRSDWGGIDGMDRLEMETMV